MGLGRGRVGEGHGDVVCERALVVDGGGEVVCDAPGVVDEEAEVVRAWGKTDGGVVDGRVGRSVGKSATNRQQERHGLGDHGQPALPVVVGGTCKVDGLAAAVPGDGHRDKGGMR